MLRGVLLVAEHQGVNPSITDDVAKVSSAVLLAVAQPHVVGRVTGTHRQVLNVVICPRDVFGVREDVGVAQELDVNVIISTDDRHNILTLDLDANDQSGIVLSDISHHNVSAVTTRTLERQTWREVDLLDTICETQSVTDLNEVEAGGHVLPYCHGYLSPYHKTIDTSKQVQPACYADHRPTGEPMFRGTAIVAIAQGVALVIASIVLTLIGFALLSPIQSIAPENRSSAAFNIPIVFFVLAGIALLAAATRIYIFWKFDVQVEDENPEMESYSDEDVAEQERIQEEHRRLDNPF